MVVLRLPNLDHVLFLLSSHNYKTALARNRFNNKTINIFFKLIIVVFYSCVFEDEI